MGAPQGRLIHRVPELGGGGTTRPSLVAGIVAALALAPSALLAQEPPDSAQVADSLAAADSLAVSDTTALLDSLAQAPDSVSADTIFHNLPRPTGGAPAGFATGVWEWDRHGIMASGANTLAELFQEVPGLVGLFGGDYGTPLAMTAFGHGAAGYRVVRDGVELYPFDGGVVDLQRIGLVGIGRVRLDRSLGQLVVEMWSHEHDDGRAFSVIEAGTGDLDTNMFRGIYTDPTALGGSVGVGLERIDTRGRRGESDEGGNRTGSWARYQLHWGDRLGLGVEYRRGATQTKVTEYASAGTRTDLTARFGASPFRGVTLGGFAGSSRLESDPRPGDFETVGGERRHAGGTLGLRAGGAWLRGTYAVVEGDLPGDRLDVDGGLSASRWGGVDGRFSRSTWNGAVPSSWGARAWASPLRSVTLFAAYEDGRWGSRVGPVREGGGPPPLIEPTDPLPDDHAVTDRRTQRAGVLLSRWGTSLGAAALQVRSDRTLPLSNALDQGSPPSAGFDRRGLEATAVLPTPWQGLTVEGSYLRWEEEGPYLPEEIYRGSFEYHRVFKETENLEVWASLGVRGHDPMLTFDADALTAEDGTVAGDVVRVPFYQSWYMRVQVRVVTVRLWLGWDNFTLRRNLKLYPGRLLPYGRSFFALRWDLWN